MFVPRLRTMWSLIRRSPLAMTALGAGVVGVLLSPALLEVTRPNPFHPHGFCYLWEPKLVGLHVISDALIGLSYFAISSTLAYLLFRARRQLPFSWMVLAFGTFIVACGATHFMEVWTLWNANYWLSGDVKLITAVASVVTAVALPPLVPRILETLRSSRMAEEHRLELEATHRRLTAAYEEAKQAREVLQEELATQTHDLGVLAENLAAQKRQISEALQERQRADRLLRISDAQLNGIINSATAAIVTIDEDQCVTLFNSGAEMLFGCTANEAIGKPLDRFIPERYREPHRKFIQAFGQTGVSTRAMGQQRELAALRADGTEFPMEAQISQITVGGAKLYTVILRDITDRKRAEMQREQLLASEQTARLEAEAASRAKDAFLATISHELRTPLSPILAWARMLSQGVLDEEKSKQALQAIERNAKSQAQLIEDLLDVSRIVSGKLRLEVRPVDIVPVIQNAIEVVRPAAEARGIGLQAVLDNNIGTVSGDPERLQQAVWNLLSNAVKFTPRGGRVQVVLERVNSHVEIAVSDTGQGIAPEFLPHVFERFQQADNTSTRQHGGLGLGLAIVRHIVELHGGSVHAESAGEGQGSVFTVKLPLVLLARRAGETERRHPSKGASIGGLSYPPLEGLRVLVVDDEPDSNEMVRALLVSCRAEVRTAASTAQALDILRRWHPDLLISDVGMPGQDGYALIDEVRAQPGDLGRLPAIALTAYAAVEDRVRLLAAGFQMHVPKPVEPIELVTVVANVARTAGKLPAAN